MWYLVTDSSGAAVAKLYAASAEDLALNVPEGCTATECEPDVADRALVSAPAPSPAPGGYTFNQWVDLFPLAEQVAIVTATMSDPLAKLIYDRAQSASGEINATDQRTVDGLRYLVSQGWVSEETFQKITNP